MLAITKDEKLVDKFKNLDCDIKLLNVGQGIEIMGENNYE